MSEQERTINWPIVSPREYSKAAVNAALRAAKDRDLWRERAESAEQAKMRLIAENDRLTANLDREANRRSESRVRFAQQWYATRWQHMDDWFRSPEMKGTEACRKWFSLVANGTATTGDPPTYAQQLNTIHHRAESAEALLATLRHDLAVATLGMPSQDDATDENRLDWLCKLATNTEAQLEAERELKELARSRWQEAQNRLASIERSLISITGIEQSSDDNLAQLEAERANHPDARRLDRLEALMRGGRWFPQYISTSIYPYCDYAFFAEPNGLSYASLRAAIDALPVDALEGK